MATRKLGVTCSGPVAGRAAPAADSHEERSSVCAGVLLDSSQAGILETGYRNTHGWSINEGQAFLQTAILPKPFMTSYRTWSHRSLGPPAGWT